MAFTKACKINFDFQQLPRDKIREISTHVGRKAEYPSLPNTSNTMLATQPKQTSPVHPNTEPSADRPNRTPCHASLITGPLPIVYDLFFTGVDISQPLVSMLRTPDNVCSFVTQYAETPPFHSFNRVSA